MKCDRGKPRCSHCVTYTTDCTYTAPCRKTGSKKRRGGTDADNTSRNTEDRLQHLEAVIEQLTARISASEQHNRIQVQPQPGQGRPIEIAHLAVTNAPTDDITDSDYDQESTCLPPLQHILPMIHSFLEDFNSVMPLFHARTLLCTIHEFYDTGSQQRDPVVWAAINIVLALAYRNSKPDSGRSNRSKEYFTRAESVLSSVMLGEIRLLNIQVLLGMVMIMQAMPDLQYALILMGTTMRLAHRIGLHNHHYSAHLDPTEAKQRAHVFWLAYILDKDLSFKSKQPAIQRDDDIDLELPAIDHDDYLNDEGYDTEDGTASAGMITTLDGTVKMNYFVTRIHLAVVQGGIYDYLYSTGSQKRNPEERSQALESVACALEKWKSSIPFDFGASAALNRTSTGTLHLLGAMYATSLACTALLNHASAWNSQWVSTLRMYATEGTEPYLPPQWETLVHEARELAILLEAMPEPEEHYFW